MPPTIAISLGDPAGIGPEITAAALRDPSIANAAHFLLFGSSESPPGPRRPSAASGRTSFDAVTQAIDAVKSGRASALVTAPISKEAWHAAGITQYPGHTELLAEAFASPDSGMLFVGPTLRVILATIHIPLRDVPRTLTPAMVERAIRVGHQACIELGIGNDKAGPRIAVAGINPHAGEHGIIGDEEPRIIDPAITRCRADGMTITGPVPGDAVFNQAADGKHDLVVAMYHDQGLIPVKLIDRRRTVNTTAGLRWQGRRIIRTSPAHGTAYDIAGTNTADPTSMIEAIKLAIKLAHEPLP